MGTALSVETLGIFKAMRGMSDVVDAAEATGDAAPSAPPLAMREGAAKPGLLRRAGHELEQRMRCAFFRLGYAVALRPWTVILVGVALALALSAGALRMRIESRDEKLWVPQGSRAQREKRFVEASFGSFRRFSEVLFTARGDGGDIGCRAALLDVVKVMAIGEKVHGEPVDGGKPTTFQERCFIDIDSDGN